MDMLRRETRPALRTARLAGALFALAALALLLGPVPPAPAADPTAAPAHIALGDALDAPAAQPPVGGSPLSEALPAGGGSLPAGGLAAHETPDALRPLRPVAVAPLAGLRPLDAEAAAAAAAERAQVERMRLGLAGLLGVAGLLLLAAPFRHRAAAAAPLDPLTGLLAREGFVERLAKRLVQDGDERRAVLAVALDRLGEINEALGRRAGDALLRGAGLRLAEAVRGSDTVARLGGDSFIILLEGVDEAGLDAAIGRLTSAVARPLPHEGAELPVGLRFGAALGPSGAAPTPDRAEALVHEAEAALAASRRDPRGGPAIFTSADRAQAERERNLLRALGEPESSPVGLVAHLQPQVRLTDGSLAGFEALLRWPHPALGALNPGEVIPVAARFGRMPQLGRGVRRSAFGTFAMLRRAGLVPLRDCHVAINISAAELVRTRFVQEVSSDLVAAGLEPTMLELEITEDVLLDDVPERGREALVALRREGVRLALDDFGTGYAGFSQLLRLPLDTLKLDRRFIRGLGTDPRAEPIILSMLGLARGLGFEVVAEGIETEAQRQRLAELGCGIGQGFGIGRPLGIEDLAVWLVGHRAQLALAEPDEKVIALRRRGG